MVRQGKYARHAWTLKVDADTVFFPARLLGYLQGVPAEEPWFVQNSVGFLGPMEVFSNGAVHAFAEKAAEACSWIVSTEDTFLSVCMYQLKVPAKTVNSLLLLSRDPQSCRKPGMVSFHPMKDVGSYTACHDVARQ